MIKGFEARFAVFQIFEDFYVFRKEEFAALRRSFSVTLILLYG